VDTLQLLSESLRGTIIAPPGKLLFVADYVGIEARVLLWCAQDHAETQKFTGDYDIYLDMASTIYGRPLTKADKHERQLGKVAILGLGYQMGAKRFVSAAATYGITIEQESDDPDEMTAQKVVDTYRAKYWRTKQLWYDQETAAGECAFSKDEGVIHECYPVKWYRSGRFLYCELPSGRKLAYPDAAIKPTVTAWGSRKNSLTYMGVNAMTRKWQRQTSYGGLLVENIVQAISRDVMAEAMLRCEESRIYFPILSVHDEAISEAHKDLGNLADYEALVAQVPTWAPGLPIAVEAWSGGRYRK
jgi:DNA polymerase